MAQQIKRYDVIEKHGIGTIFEVENINGRYVLWEDVAPIIAEALKPSHNSPMREIALILREFISDANDNGITDTKYYHQKIDAVIAQLSA